MQIESSNEKPNLTVLKGGRISLKEFATLSLTDKISYLRERPANEKMKYIIEDPDSKNLTRGLQPQEVYWTIKDVGETDALELLELSSPEQCLFFLDMELWNQWEFSTEKANEWFGYLLELGEKRAMEQLRVMDLELLALYLKRQIFVGGGLGDILTDEERTADWDHSFDNMYYITFRIQEDARLVGTLLETIYKNDESLYLTLMEGVKGEVDIELEDSAFRFRNGRLADLGFPEYDEAVSVYARINPDTFTPHTDKELMRAADASNPPVPILHGSFLQRVLSRYGTNRIMDELNHLISNVLVAEGKAPADSGEMRIIFERVYGYITIALEHLTGDDEQAAGKLIQVEFLKRLFQLGYSIVMRLKDRATELKSNDPRVEAVLAGLRANRPRYYRVLDQDAFEGFREFRDLADVRTVEHFLATASKS